MHGNVWEWVQDCYQSSYQGAPADGSAWEVTGSSYRVSRGGGWNVGARYCRSANRGRHEPASRLSNLGFRPAR